MISIDEAVENGLSHVDVLVPENKPLLESLGQVLAEDIYPGLASIYINAIDPRQAEHDVLLPLKWIATLDLDRQAFELEYIAGDLTPALNSRRGHQRP